MTSSRRQPPIVHDRHLNDLTALIAQYGGAAWMLDDPVGSTTARELRGLYPGTVSPSGVTFGQPGPVLGGDLKAAAGLNGAGDISSTYFPSGAFTFLGWWKSELTTATRPVFSFRDDVWAGGYSFNFFDTGRALLCLGQSNFRYWNLSFAANAWYFLAVTIPGGDINSIQASAAYINGSPLTTYSTTATGAANVRIKFNLARLFTERLNGQIGPTAIIPAALSANDIFALYMGATGG